MIQLEILFLLQNILEEQQWKQFMYFVVLKKRTEVFASRYDLRYLLNGMIALSYGEKPDLPLTPLQKMKVAKLIKVTDTEDIQ